MKKFVLVLTVILFAFSHNTSARENPAQSQFSSLLEQYYGIKNALVGGNGANAALQAEAFLKTISNPGFKSASQENIKNLQEDAAAISRTKDVARQRNYFARFSSNMTVLAKEAQHLAKPIYQLYCPMKKTTWLSEEKDIKNPYYGSVMLTCGQVTQVIQ